MGIMQINFLFSNSSLIQNIRGAKFLDYTPIQKKVFLIATVILAAFSILILAYKHLSKKSTSVIENKDTNFIDTKPTEIKPIDTKDTDTKSTETKPIDTKPTDTQPTKIDLVKTKVHRTVAEKLERNRQFAAEEQSNEKANDRFKMMEGEIPAQLVGKDLHGEAHHVDTFAVGIASCEGRRNRMEDAEIAVGGSFSSGEINYPFQLFGVFDGHGGTSASAYVKDNILTVLTDLLKSENPKELTDEGIFKALKETFKQLDAQFTSYASGTTAYASGTTATVSLILNGKVWVANVGDARTVLVKSDGTATQASEDAKPSVPRFEEKINKLGGIVIDRRVNGILGVARAVGDKNFKKVVSSNPKITCYPLDEFKDGYLVLACDGLWDTASTQNVGNVIKEMDEKKQSVQEMSQRLVWGAIENHSNDNVTAMVIRL